MGGAIMDVMINELKPKGINTVGRDYRLTHLSEKDGYLFGSKVGGEFFVQCFQDGAESSGSFWGTLEEAKLEVSGWMDNRGVLLQEGK